MNKEQRGKVMVGKVVSDKMQKTAVVVVETRRAHPLYGKTITVRRRFKAHNEEPLAKAGDTVRIVESRPLSREKRWRIVEIVKPGEIIELVGTQELEALRETERAEKEARKQEERQRAAERLARLGGFESVAEAAGETGEESEFEAEYGSDEEEVEEGDEE
jgi:small subunit ribosomal protein S17